MGRLPKLGTIMSRLFLGGIFFASAGVVAWIALVYTVHLGTVAVPELRGEEPDKGDLVAHDLGLVMQLDEPGVYSEAVPAGKIAYQQPVPGFHLKAGSIVRVRLSLGNERAVIPPVNGESLQAAVRLLEGEGLEIGERSEISGNGPADAIHATSPGVGAEVAPGSRVDLLMNHTPARPMWVMPALLSRSLGAVRRFASDHRLRIGRVHEVDYPGLPAGIVLRQYPPAGSPMSRSDIITLWVSR
jgi:serine/threonine-protein kinase